MVPNGTVQGCYTHFNDFDWPSIKLLKNNIESKRTCYSSWFITIKGHSPSHARYISQVCCKHTILRFQPGMTLANICPQRFRSMHDAALFYLTTKLLRNRLLVKCKRLRIIGCSNVMRYAQFWWRQISRYLFKIAHSNYARGCIIFLIYVRK